MIKVETITIKEFRGIRNLTMNFSGNNFAICGPNGTGKSGIVDALEFALTGNISRLSGKGTGGVSVKEHAPHVDSRNDPMKASVEITMFIPSLNKHVTLERNVKNPLSPKITPTNQDILKILEQVSLHPEFVLSRRELIRYVISAPGDRAKEVQALLRLDEIENLRTIFQKIANSSQKEVAPLKREKDNAEEQLVQSLEITELSKSKMLGAVNSRRSLIGLQPITILTAATSLKDGLVTATSASQSSRVSKIQALADIDKVHEILSSFSSPENIDICKKAIEKISVLSADPLAESGITREQFLMSALELIDSEACPVCETPWKIDELKKVINSKLKHFEEVKAKRIEIESSLESITLLLNDTVSILESIGRYGALLNPIVDTQPIKDFVADIKIKSKDIKEFIPLSQTIASLKKFNDVPSAVLDAITVIEDAVNAIPDLNQQDAARDYLIIGQERLEAYRGVSLRHKRAEERADLTRKVSDTYVRVSTEMLSNIYKEVEKEFSRLYCLINHDDEGGFSARLNPSLGKLGFDVDFYGRGFFPPGAYHSEGHQDGMGICLYLSLMKHLLGQSFKFAVLDDVLMSVDSGHRREICKLLKDEFPDTQFIFTTHDPIWLKHMQTEGLISGKSFMHFRVWNVDQGPIEWEDKDIWNEIHEELKKNNVRAAAGLLRYYLEFISAEICHQIRARVEYRSDAKYELGDLLPSATSHFKKILKKGKEAAQSWNQTEEIKGITSREKEFDECVAKSSIEQWQINPAIHFNNWENLQATEFAPVVVAYQELVKSFFCQNDDCNSILYLVLKQNQPEALRCSCGSVNINLKKK